MTCFHPEPASQKLGALSIFEIFGGYSCPYLKLQWQVFMAVYKAVQFRPRFRERISEKDTRRRFKRWPWQIHVICQLLDFFNLCKENAYLKLHLMGLTSPRHIQNSILFTNVWVSFLLRRVADVRNIYPTVFLDLRPTHYIWAVLKMRQYI